MKNRVLIVRKYNAIGIRVGDITLAFGSNLGDEQNLHDTYTSIVSIWDDKRLMPKC